MILTEFNQERHDRTLREEGRQQERERLQQEREQMQQEKEKHEAVQTLLLQLVKAGWQLPEEVLKRITAETDLDTLQFWTSLAKDCGSSDDFAEKILASVK